MSRKKDSRTLTTIISRLPSVDELFKGIYPRYDIPEGVDVTQGRYLVSLDDIPSAPGKEVVVVYVLYYQFKDYAATLTYFNMQEALQIVELALKQYVPGLTIHRDNDTMQVPGVEHEIKAPVLVVHFGNCDNRSIHTQEGHLH